jgi:hypothetical protein
MRDHEGLHLTRPVPPGVASSAQSVVETDEEKEEEEYQEDEDEEEQEEEPARESREEQAAVSHDNISEVGAESVHREQRLNEPQVIRIPEAAVIRQRVSGAIVFEVKYGDMTLEVPYGPGTRIISIQPPRQSMVAVRSGWDDVDLESGMESRTGSTVPRSRRREEYDEVESGCSSHCAIM